MRGCSICGTQGGDRWLQWHETTPHVRCVDCGWVGVQFSTHAARSHRGEWPTAVPVIRGLMNQAMCPTCGHTGRSGR